jgi:hypothetical protein
MRARGELKARASQLTSTWFNPGPTSRVEETPKTPVVLYKIVISPRRNDHPRLRKKNLRRRRMIVRHPVDILTPASTHRHQVMEENTAKVHILAIIIEKNRLLHNTGLDLSPTVGRHTHPLIHRGGGLHRMVTAVTHIMEIGINVTLAPPHITAPIHLMVGTNDRKDEREGILWTLVGTTTHQKVDHRGHLGGGGMHFVLVGTTCILLMKWEEQRLVEAKDNQDVHLRRSSSIS